MIHKKSNVETLYPQFPEDIRQMWRTEVKSLYRYVNERYLLAEAKLNKIFQQTVIAVIVDAKI